MWQLAGMVSLGPIFENYHGRTVTVNQDNYRHMIKDFYLPEISRQA